MIDTLNDLPSDLPQGWVWAEVSDVGKVVTGTTPKTTKKEYYGKDYPFFKPTDLNAGYYVKGSAEGLSRQGMAVARLLPEKSILVTCIGATIGKIGFARVMGATNQQINAVITQSDGVIPEYLYFLLASPKLFKMIRDNASSTTLPILNKSKFEKIPLPIAPVYEQRRIVSKIEELFTKLDAGVEELRKAKVQLKQYRTALLFAAFNGSLTEGWRGHHKQKKSTIESLHSIIFDRKMRYETEKKQSTIKGLGRPKKDYDILDISENRKIPSWADARLQNLIYIAGRIGWRGLKAEEYTEDGPLFLSVYNLRNRRPVDYSDANHISSQRYSESPEIQLKENDILLVKDGSGIGKIGIVKNLTQPATVNSSLLVIRAREMFIPEYLFYFLQGPEMQNLVKIKITGSATPHLFQRDVLRFILPIPPREEQEEIIRILENKLSVIEKIAEVIEMSLAFSERMRQSILTSAFAGRLVPQDPHDEPAIVLLNRIRLDAVHGRAENNHKYGIPARLG